jgi:spectrin beta
METDDVGRDLAAVEVLARKQDALESEMTAVENKLQDHGRDAVLLSDKYPHSVQHLQGKMEELQNQWEKLLSARERRRNNLKGSQARQKFLSDVNDLEQWVSETIKRMESHQIPNSVSEAESLLALNNELKAEINGRNENFAKLINFGRSFSESEDPDIVQGKWISLECGSHRDVLFKGVSKIGRVARLHSRSVGTAQGSFDLRV